MEPKTLIWAGLFIGSTIGGFIPSLWGAGFLSISSIVFSTLGGLAGVWLGFRLSKF